MAAAEQELVVVRGLEGVDGCLIILGIFFDLQLLLHVCLFMHNINVIFYMMAVMVATIASIPR